MFLVVKQEREIFAYVVQFKVKNDKDKRHQFYIHSHYYHKATPNGMVKTSAKEKAEEYCESLKKEKNILEIEIITLYR